MKLKVFFRHIQQLIFFICILSVPLFVWASEELEVVINPQITEKELSVNTLRAIFGMRMQTWSDGTKIRVFVLADDAPLHQQFSKELLNVFPYQLRSAWDRLVFSGIGHAPVKVTSTRDMLEKIASTPGAIGYLWRAEIDDSVEVLQVKR